MIKKIMSIALISLLITPLGVQQPSYAQEGVMRIKDITHVEGVRDNQLIGYGVVIGLQGTGDNSRSTQITNQNMLNNLGTVISNFNDIKKGNTAAVIVTATIPAFAKSGDKLDVTVSSMADAKSLAGGVLVQTQLMAPNGEVVAVAQGPLSVGGISISSAGSSKRTSVTTSGRVPGGAIVERDINTMIGDESSIKLILNKADYTMAARIAQTVNQNLSSARAMDGATVKILIPERFQNDRVGFMSILENLTVKIGDSPAKVVVNERTGTVIIGNEVKLLPAAIAHGNLTVSIKSSYDVSQPEMFSGGRTEVVQTSEIDIDKGQGSLITLSSNSNLNDLIKALNTIGVSPIDLISILQALKTAGSLQATLEII